jgi:hypothetical protein
MEMDRPTLLALAGAIVALAIFSGFFFAPKGSARYERPAYAQDDIRYKYQQADLKEKAKAKKKKNRSAPAASVDEGDATSENEEPAIDGDSAEEPPLD